MSFRAWVVSSVIGALGLGCASAQTNDDRVEDVAEAPSILPGRGETMPTVRYERSAEANWTKAEDAFQDENYLGAQRYYSYIRTKFPYSRYAVRAELRIGDCQYERGRYLEAIDSFQNFARMHPTHEQVAYALYRVGMAYYEQIPGDWFMLPPSHEKDQGAVRDAARALADYVKRFPKHENFEAGKEALRTVRTKLMDHERYVADFYANLDRDRAYVGRLEVIRTKFQDVGRDADLLLEMIEVYVRIGELDQAKERLAELKKDFADSENVAEAESMIARAPVPDPPAETTPEAPAKTPPDAPAEDEAGSVTAGE